MSKNAEIESLLLKEIEERPVVYDGIVDKAEFYKAGGQKILFLLKDVNGTMRGTKSIDYEKNPSFISETQKRALKQKEDPVHWKQLCYWSELKRAAEKYGDVLRREIEIISPAYAKSIYQAFDDCEDKEPMSSGTSFFVSKAGLRFVEFVHPSARVTLAATYAYAREVGKELGLSGNVHRPGGCRRI